MNVYDFDKTIYRRNSTADFYFFVLRRHPSILRHFPYQLVGFIRYGIGNIDVTAMKSYLYVFLKDIKDIDQEIVLFWDKHISRINNWYLDRHRSDDLIISGSPRFLVEEGCRRLKVTNLIASEVDRYSGRVLAENCSGHNKVTQLKKAGYKCEDIEEFYSDSHSDDPLASLAEKAYMVKGEKLSNWRFDR